MSSPIPSFGSLNISQMEAPQSSSSARGEKPKGKGKSGGSDSEDDYSSEEESHGAAFDKGKAKEEAPELTHLFALDQCRTHAGMYSFQMAHAPLRGHAVRVKPDAEPQCSCNERNCPPMQWLWRYLDEQTPLSPPLTPHEQITNVGIQTICDGLDAEMRQGLEDWQETNWILRKDFSVQDPQQRKGAFMKRRIRAIQEIMASLSKNVIPDDYRRDLFDAPDDLLTGNLFIIGDIEYTMIRILTTDDYVFRRFDTLVSNEIRASQYIQAMSSKVSNTFDLLDDYCATGDAPGRESHNVIWCAQALVTIVQNISVTIDHWQPLSPELREQAGILLVSILESVVNRNVDAYQHLAPAQRRRRHAETTRIDGNLYELLIGSGNSPKNPSGGDFVLNHLQNLPEARSQLEVLEDILHRRLSSKGWGPAPRAYTEKLGRIINQQRGAVRSGPSSSTGGSRTGRPSAGGSVGPASRSERSGSTAGKRSADTLGGRAKRMK